MNPDRLTLTLSDPQNEFWYATALYQNLEGAVRSGKTTIALSKVIARCQAYPGLRAMICRWKEQEAYGQLKGRLVELFGPGLLWHAEEGYFELEGDSRIYVRGLKPGEETARYSKFAGLTLAVIYIDQPEEVPRDFYDALKARLSQPGYPHEMYLTPNPLDEGHWLSTEFPEDNSHPDQLYIRTTVYDNRVALGERYIQELERAYPVGHPLRARYIEGRRGIAVIGTPVYQGYFSRFQHLVDGMPADPALPLYEGWDFGHAHPITVWAQLPRGGAVLRFLGGVMGEGVFIEDFAPFVRDLRQEWFPMIPEAAVLRAGDPAGATKNSQGTSQNAATILQSYGFPLTTGADWNVPERRNFAIQTLSGYMRRTMPDGEPCFQLNPQFLRISHERRWSQPVLAEAFEAGYVWDELSTARLASPNTRRPRKDGTYDHGMNACEYLTLAFAPGQPAALAGVFHGERMRVEAQVRDEKERARALRLAQQDTRNLDEQRWRWVRRRGGLSRVPQ